MNFKMILDFILEYWREILSIICLFISVVFYIIKKRPRFNYVDSIKEDVLEFLPSVINAVEVDGKGQQKKEFVMDAIIKYVDRKYHLDFSFYNQWLNDVIEDILSTPSKHNKEVSNDKR